MISSDIADAANLRDEYDNAQLGDEQYPPINPHYAHEPKKARPMDEKNGVLPEFLSRPDMAP